MKITFSYIIFDDAKLQSIVTAILRQYATICDNMRQFRNVDFGIKVLHSEIRNPHSEIVWQHGKGS
jgi:hypothetical protein